MSNKKILLIGENGKDIWRKGSIRQSPESPTWVFKQTSETENPGMAANVCENLLSLDPTLDITFCHQAEVITKTRYIDQESDYQLFRVDENDDGFEPDFWNKVIDQMVWNNNDYQALVISDYNKSLISDQFIEAITDIFKELGKPVWVDTKKVLGQWSRDIDFVKINEKEFQYNLKSGCYPWACCKNLIVTRGKNGIDLYNNEGNVIYHVDSVAQDVWSVSGAGDSVLSALVVKYLNNGGNIKTAIDYANKVAAIAVSKPGVVAVSKDEVNE